LTDTVKEKKDRICTPKGAFITLRDEISYNALEGCSSISVEKTKCAIRRAPEPTNVIWENIGYPARDRHLKQVLVALAMLVIFTLSYLVIKYVMNTQELIIGRYHSTIDCKTLMSFYGGKV
jgi:hypothetical protein